MAIVNNIKTLRPKIGLDADKFFNILGKKTKKKINENEPIFFSDLKKWLTSSI